MVYNHPKMNRQDLYNHILPNEEHHKDLGSSGAQWSEIKRNIYNSFPQILKQLASTLFWRE